MPTGLITSPRFLDHLTGPGHPESPDRLTAILDRLESTGLASSLHQVIPEKSDTAIPELIHQRGYLNRVREACENDWPFLDTPDNPIGTETYDVAVLASNAVVIGADLIFSGTVENAMALVRPPGHHADESRAMGFCFFNNAAIAARYVQEHHEADKVVIIDFDVHHGNGTQNIFEEIPSVMYISLHRFPFYPGTGSADETGRGNGKGTNVNYPLSASTGDETYLDIVENSLSDIVLRFQPDFVILSSGFDAHERDPLGGMKVTTEGYGKMTHLFKKLAEEVCNGKLLSILEGGYNLEALADSVNVHLEVLSGRLR